MPIAFLHWVETGGFQAVLRTMAEFSLLKKLVLDF
jgi:hypothetical protein